MGEEAAVFPAWSEADWRKAARAALKGASLDTLICGTADGIRIEPLYSAADGPPRVRRAQGPWWIVARLDHPDPREANDQALDDLAGGADGLQVVFAGAIGAYGFGLKRSDPATLHAAFDGVPFDRPQFELDLGRDGLARRSPSQRSSNVPAPAPRSAPSPSASILFAAAARGPVSGGLDGARKPVRRGRAGTARPVFRALPRRRRAERARRGRHAGAGACLRARGRRQPAARTRRRGRDAATKRAARSRSASRPTRINSSRCRNSARCALPGRGSSRLADLRRAQPASKRRAPGA